MFAMDAGSDLMVVTIPQLMTTVTHMAIDPPPRSLTITLTKTSTLRLNSLSLTPSSTLTHSLSTTPLVPPSTSTATPINPIVVDRPNPNLPIPYDALSLLFSLILSWLVLWIILFFTSHRRTLVSILLLFPLFLPSLLLHLFRPHFLAIIFGNLYPAWLLDALTYMSLCAALVLALDTLGVWALRRALWMTTRRWWSGDGWVWAWGWRDGVRHWGNQNPGEWRFEYPRDGEYEQPHEWVGRARVPWERQYGLYL
jgi:hypothetical protein